MPSAFLLTYNPIYWTWEQSVRKKAITALKNGGTVPDRWNTGSRRRGIEIGDHVFVLQQGSGKRGLIAQGLASSEIFQAPHWDGIEGHVGNYVDVVWTAITLAPYADINDLRIAVDGLNWSPRQSGLQVPTRCVPSLLEFSAHMLAPYTEDG